MAWRFGVCCHLMQHSIAPFSRLGPRLSTNSQVVSAKSDLEKVKAEKVLLLDLVETTKELVASKNKHVELLQMNLDLTTRDLVQAVARKSAVICNRVLLDTGLRGGPYDPRQPFTVRYDLFKSQEVLAEDGRQLSDAALLILKEIPQEYQVKPTDIKKEMEGLAHQISKPFHYLQDSREAGLYVGGDTVTMVTISLLVALMQQKGLLEGPINAVDERGRFAYSIVDGHVGTASDLNL